MGTTESKQRLGEKVIAARKKLEEHKQTQTDRLKLFESKSPETLKVIIQSIAEAFKTCAPFLELSLLIAWESDPNQCKSIILKSCKKVLTAPIIKDEYEWFKQYVLSSSVWFYKVNENDTNYMFEELLKIVQDMSQDIIASMDSIYSLFQSHPKWNTLMNIKNKTLIDRQDDKAVGLLNEKGITDILDLKEEKVEEVQTFIDSNLAVNMLTTTAKQIDGEFQHHMDSVMSRYGEVKSGPVKKVDRCQSKVENDYASAKFPKAAKLLDLIRCSVTFNTLDQLLDGYKGLMSHIKGNPSMVELARIKNGFLDPNYSNGYRDIKINIVYHSQNPMNNGKSMICEVQLLLLNYLHEKKRIHKLYSIARSETFFQMVVNGAEQNQNNVIKDMRDLKFTQISKVENVVPVGKCSVDTRFGLLAMETRSSFSCMDINSNEFVFEQTTTCNARQHSHRWIDRNGDKLVSVQTSKNTIQFFKILKMNNKFEFKENEALKICYGENDQIYFCEFDLLCENIFTVVNGEVFEQRSIKDINTVKGRVTLEQKVGTGNNIRQLDLSNDGSLCVIAGGSGKNYFYIIDIQSKKQFKFTSSTLTSTWAPRFINGDAEYVAIGKEQVEIWDVAKRTAIKVIKPGLGAIYAMAATNNILALCSYFKGVLQLYDVRNWEMFYSEKVGVEAVSLHLTADSKYLTIGGGGTIKCVVLEIN